MSAVTNTTWRGLLISTLLAQHLSRLALRRITTDVRPHRISDIVSVIRCWPKCLSSYPGKITSKDYYHLFVSSHQIQTGIITLSSLLREYFAKLHVLRESVWLIGIPEYFILFIASFCHPLCDLPIWILLWMMGMQFDLNLLVIIVYTAITYRYTVTFVKHCITVLVCQLKWCCNSGSLVKIRLFDMAGLKKAVTEISWLGVACTESSTNNACNELPVVSSAFRSDHFLHVTLFTLQ